MFFIVATVGEVDGFDFTLAERHGRSALRFCSGNSQRSDLKVATPGMQCSIKLTPASSYSHGLDDWSIFTYTARRRD